MVKFEFLGLRLARFQNFIKFGPVFKRQKRTKNGGLQKYANENEALTQRAILIYFYLLEKLSYLLTMTMLVMVWQGAYGKGRMARFVCLFVGGSQLAGVHSKTSRKNRATST